MEPLTASPSDWANLRWYILTAMNDIDRDEPYKAKERMREFIQLSQKYIH